LLINTCLPIKLDEDPVQRRKAEQLNDPPPTFATYGPRNRAELLAFRRWEGDLPSPSVRTAWRASRRTLLCWQRHACPVDPSFTSIAADSR
jgi:hypothetical protein